MKTFLLSVFFLLSFFNNFAQVNNVRQGNWSDSTVWNTNAVPTANDDVQLHFDITVNSNAVCHSLNANGHNVTVNTGANLSVTGNAGSDTLLYRLVGIDTTLTSPFDTAEVISYTYDSLKRNITMTEEWYSPDDGTINEAYWYKFFYVGTERQPYKVLSYTPLYQPGDPNYYENTVFYRYQNSKIISDSSGWTIRHYIYLPNAVVKQNILYYQDSAVVTSSDTIQVRYENGNIVEQIGTQYQYPEGTFKYVYDNHPNPFRNTALVTQYAMYQPETFIYEVFAKNNAIEVDQITSSPRFHYVTNYEYGSNGYPVAGRSYFVDDPTIFAKWLYFYGH